MEQSEEKSRQKKTSLTHAVKNKDGEPMNGDSAASNDGGLKSRKFLLTILIFMIAAAGPYVGAFFVPAQVWDKFVQFYNQALMLIRDVFFVYLGYNIGAKAAAKSNSSQ